MSDKNQERTGKGIGTVKDQRTTGKGIGTEIWKMIFSFFLYLSHSVPVLFCRISVPVVFCTCLILCLSFSAPPAQAVDALYLKKNDRQPYYYAQVVDAYGAAVDLTNATIYCTMKSVTAGTLKISRQTTGINITDAVNGKFEYRWQTADTATAGKYAIEFEINPSSGGKFTVPADDIAPVYIKESLDTQ